MTTISDRMTVGDAILFEEHRLSGDMPSVCEIELSGKEQVEKNRAAWEKFFDDTLIEWGRDTAALEDEGFIPPSIEAVNQACKVVRDCQDAGWPPPTKIVPDGEGGISFERTDGTLFESLNIYADQSMELLTFNDCRLCSRLSL
jgi:hypothetical protein